MVKVLDLRFQGVERVIASFLLESKEGPILIETGPESAYARLVAALEEASVGQDIQAGHEALAWRGEEPGAKPPRVRPFRPPISLPGRAENGPPGARGQVGRAVVQGQVEGLAQGQGQKGDQKEGGPQPRTASSLSARYFSAIMAARVPAPTLVVSWR